MSKPLNHAELMKAVSAAMDDIEECEGLPEEEEIILAAFQAIAKRAFEQAAIPLGRFNGTEYGDERAKQFTSLIIGDPPDLLAHVLAALDATEKEPVDPATP